MCMCAGVVGDCGSSVSVCSNGSRTELEDKSHEQHNVYSLSTSTDIGLIAEMSQNTKKHLSDAHRLHLLDTQWTASEGFSWPCTPKREGDKVRMKYLGPQHFRDVYTCFEYSIVKRGMFCKPCVLFAPDSVHGVPLNTLVKTPLNKYSHLTGKDGRLTSHLTKSFHEDSVTRANGLRSGIHVHEQMDKAAAEERKKNRAALSRILHAIEYHGRLGLSLRGHRDSGKLQTTMAEAGSDQSDVDYDEAGSDISYTQGNFRACLQLMVSCNDEILKQHINGCASNASYISPKSQNELIDAIASVMQQEVMKE